MKDTSLLSFFVGRPICHKAFLSMHGIGRHRLNALLKHYNEVGLVPRDFFYKGRNTNRSLNSQDVQFMLKYLNNIAEIHSLALPGRVPGKVIGAGHF